MELHMVNRFSEWWFVCVCLKVKSFVQKRLRDSPVLFCNIIHFNKYPTPFGPMRLNGFSGCQTSSHSTQKQKIYLLVCCYSFVVLAIALLLIYPKLITLFNNNVFLVQCSWEPSGCDAKVMRPRYNIHLCFLKSYMHF